MHELRFTEDVAYVPDKNRKHLTGQRESTGARLNGFQLPHLHDVIARLESAHVFALVLPVDGVLCLVHQPRVCALIDFEHWPLRLRVQRQAPVCQWPRIGQLLHLERLKNIKGKQDCIL